MDKTKYKFSQNEYLTLRNELVERIKLINSHISTALITILSTWTAGITIKVIVYSEKIAHMSVDEYLIFRLLGSLFFLIPIIFFVPLSVKCGENLIQLASLSAYIRVFYDYLSSKSEYMNWETSNNLFSNANVDRYKKSSYMRLYNEEYTFLAIISYILYSTMAYVDIKKLFSYHISKESVSFERYIILVCYIVLYIIIPILIYVIHITSGMKHTLMKYTVFYVNAYINRAVQLQVISESEIEDAIKKLNPIVEIDLKKYI